MFSILIPIYNGIEFLDESINSVINQTYTDWEVLIGINGHHKNSDVFKHAKKYETDKIKIFDFFDLKNKPSTLNRLVSYAKYDTICLLDVDDIWLPTKLEEQLPFIKLYDVVGTKCKYFGDRDDEPSIPIYEIGKYMFNHVNPIINSSCCIKKEYAKWDESLPIVEDYELWLRLNSEDKKFYNVNKSLIFHRIHKKSNFNTNNDLEIKYIQLIKTKYT